MRNPLNTFVAKTASILDTPLRITSYRRLCLFCNNPGTRTDAGPTSIAFTDLNMLFLRKKDDVFKRITDEAIDLFVPDGASLRLLLRRKGVPIGESLSGDRFMHFCCLRSPDKLRHCLLGGTESESAGLIERLKRHNPRLNLVGHWREVSAKDEGSVVEEIIRSAPDILWICLPTPQQEEFLSRWKSKLPCRLSLLVGAGFDFRRGIGPAERKAWQRSTPWVRRNVILTRRLLRRFLHLPSLVWFLRAHLPRPRREILTVDSGPWLDSAPLWRTRMRWRASAACSAHRLRHAFRAFSKRAFDLVGASILAIALLPALLLTSLIILMVDGGPIFFAQRRVGKNGKVFKMWKFRTMRRDAELIASKAQDHKIDGTGECFVNPHDDRILKLRRILLQHSRSTKYPRDPRIIPFGRFIRKVSLDEVPQILNILIGNMSLVGPRPFVTYEVAEYSPRHLLRHEVKPGLTGTWQISDRNNLTFDESISMDLSYIKNQNFWLDLKIVLLTIPSAFKNRGGE